MLRKEGRCNWRALRKTVFLSNESVYEIPFARPPLYENTNAARSDTTFCHRDKNTRARITDAK